MAEKKKANKKSTAKKATTKKKHSRGRPSVMTAATLQKLEIGFLKGLSDKECCSFAEISPATLYNYCEKYPDFLERKELLKDRPKIKAKINIAEAIEEGDMDTSKWYLDRKCKEEFSTKQDIGIFGTVNNPMEGLTTEELKKLIGDE